MELELLMRRERKKEMSKADREDFNIQKLLPNFDEDQWFEEHKDEREYDYVPVTIDVRDACPFSMHDKEHTHIFLKGGLSFIAKIKYDSFQAIRSTMIGSSIRFVDDFHQEVVTIPPPETKPKRTK